MDTPPPYTSHHGYGTVPSDDTLDLFGYEPRSRVLHAFYSEDVKARPLQIYQACLIFPPIGCFVSYWLHYREEQRARASVLIVTENELVLHIRPHRNCCCTSCCIASTDTVTIDLGNITDVRAKSLPCCGPRALFIDTYSSPIDPRDLQRIPELIVCHLRDPDVVRKVILDVRYQARREYSNVPTTVNIVTEPVEQNEHPTRADPPTRCRLTLATQADGKRYVVVIDLSSSWENICAKCATKVGLDPNIRVVLTLTNGAELSDPSELSPDDFLLVSNEGCPT